MKYEPYDDPKFGQYAALTQTEAELRKSAIKTVDYTITIALMKGFFCFFLIHGINKK